MHIKFIIERNTITKSSNGKYTFFFIIGRTGRTCIEGLFMLTIKKNGSLQVNHLRYSIKVAFGKKWKDKFPKKCLKHAETIKISIFPASKLYSKISTRYPTSKIRTKS